MHAVQHCMFLYTRSTTDISSSVDYMHKHVIHGGHLGAPRAVPPRVRSARIRYATTALARLTGTAWYSCGIFQGQGTHTYTHTDLEIVEKCAGDACAQHGLNRGTQCLVNDSLAHHGLVRLFSPREGGEYV